MLFVDSVTEGVIELLLPSLRFSGLGNSRGPLGILTFSRSVLLLLWLKFVRCSRPAAARVADAGAEGFRKAVSAVVSGSMVVRWNFRLNKLVSAVSVS